MRREGEFIGWEMNVDKTLLQYNYQISSFDNRTVTLSTETGFNIIKLCYTILVTSQNPGCAVYLSTDQTYNISCHVTAYLLHFIGHVIVSDPEKS